MTHIHPGDLITISPNEPIYPAAYSSPAAPPSGPHYTPALVIGVSNYYINIILPSGATAWIHNGSCRLARKADRT
jgi:hypothetical protein